MALTKSRAELFALSGLLTIVGFGAIAYDICLRGPSLFAFGMSLAIGVCSLMAFVGSFQQKIMYADVCE